jgi:8-oxo-dGTP pyrophosphatase MutT (NUDIX family)
MSKEVEKQKAYGCVPVCPKGDGTFLLVQNANDDDSPDHWGFPKGHQEPFEYKVNTALRELEEETGLLPDELAKDEIFQESYMYEDDKKKVDKRNTYYLALFVDPREAQSSTDEILEARWVSFEEAKELMDYQSTRDVLTEAYMRLAMNGIL